MLHLFTPLRVLMVLLALVSLSAAQGPGWTHPRTRWGHPDLQGIFTNSNEYATPFERPDRFEGRHLEDITAQELADIRRMAQEQMVAALPGGRVRGPDEWWLQNLDLRKRSQPWSVIDPPDGKIPPMTAEGQQRAIAAGRVRSSFVGGPFDGPEDLNFLERCITRSVPGSMIPVMYSNTYQILQTPDYVAITYELIHDTRIIPLDGRPHVGPSIQQHMGDARGRWDGTTLVVETTNFRPQTAYRGANAATLRVIERFTRVAADLMTWVVTLEDPGTWTRPWSFRMLLTPDSHQLLAFDCHEHNYGMRNILSAARADEKAASEASAAR